MSVFISHTTIDCHDAYSLSEWWRRVLDYEMDPDDPNEPGHEQCPIHDPVSGHTLLFHEVPDKALPAKRVHLDVRPRRRPRDEEVEWLLEQGAELLADRRDIHGPGSGWVLFGDPEGNQFCVLRSPQELREMEAVG